MAEMCVAIVLRHAYSSQPLCRVTVSRGDFDSSAVKRDEGLPTEPLAFIGNYAISKVASRSEEGKTGLNRWTVRDYFSRRLGTPEVQE